MFLDGQETAELPPFLGCSMVNSRGFSKNLWLIDDSEICR